jgi:hypothetical protein
MGWLDHNDFISREGGMAEGIFAVALFEKAAAFNGQGDQKAKQKLTNNRSVGIRFGPIRLLQVAQDNNTTLSSNGITELIRFDGKDGHGRDNCGMKCGNRSSINDDKCVLVNEGVILLLIGIMPNKAIGEGRSKGTDKRGRAGLSKPGGRNMTARAKEDGRGARRRYGVPAGEQGLLMESLAPRVREVNKAMFMNNLPSSITADKEPIKVRVKIQLTTNIETINFQHNLGTNRHPRGKGGGKGVTKGVILGKMGKSG